MGYYTGRIENSSGVTASRACQKDPPAQDPGAEPHRLEEAHKGGTDSLREDGCQVHYRIRTRRPREAVGRSLERQVSQEKGLGAHDPLTFRVCP